MSSSYIASNWRLLNQENSNKSDNYGLSFSGNEFINCGSSSALLTTGAFSVSFWMKTTVTADDALVLMDDWSAGNRNWQIAHLSSGNVIRFYVFGSSSAFVLANTSINDGNWHHVVCTYEPSTALRIYIDGSLDNSNTTSIPATRNNSAANLRIGKDDFNQYYTGSISEVAVFDYSLSSTQISTLYGSSSLGAGNPMALKPAPVAFYNLGDNTSGGLLPNPSPPPTNISILTQPNEAVEDASVFEFDGSSQSVILPNNTLSSITGDFAFSFWFNQSGNGSGSFGEGYLLGAYTGGGGAYSYLQIYSRSNDIWVNIKTSGGTFAYIRSGSTQFTNNTWNNVIVQRSGNDIEIYINGNTTPIKTQTISGDLRTDWAYSRLGQYLTIGYFNGEISNVAFWNSDQTTEISNIYNSGVPATSYTNTPTAWYKLDQSSNWEADTSGAWQIPDAVSAYPQSFDFDGSNYITAGDVNIIEQDDNGSLPYSISLWVNIPYSSATQVLLSKQPNSGSYNGFSIYRSNTLINFLLGSGLSPQARIIGSSGFSGYFGTWTNICLTYDGSRDISGFNLYFNKEPKTITTSANQPPQNVLNTADFEIGSRGGGSLKYIGKISNVQVWNTELSSTEVETLYNNGTPLTTAIALDNLKAWYKLDNTATFSTNWSVPDASGNGNTGTSSGMTEQNLVNNNVSALNGESSGMTSASLVLSDLSKSIPYDSYSFNFDGTNDYIDCGNNSSLNINGDLTISAWVNIDIHKQLNGVVSKISSTDRNYEILVRDTGQVSFYTSSTEFTTSTQTITVNTWTNIIVTVESGVTNGVKFYFNGVQDSTTGTQTVVANTANLNIGRRTTGGFVMDGKISNLSIFNEALTSTEVLKLYANGVPQDLTNFTPQPVAWYPLGSNSFWNGSQWTVRDMIGSNDGTGQNIGIDGLVGDSPRSSANGTGSNMDIPSNLVGTTKWSSNNSYSINMSSEARTTDVP